jgi:hypothetical protein
VDGTIRVNTGPIESPKKSNCFQKVLSRAILSLERVDAKGKMDIFGRNWQASNCEVGAATRKVYR